MANPLPREDELYEQIRKRKLKVAPEIWDLLYDRIGDDLSSINLLCEYYLKENTPLPADEVGKILFATRHITDIVRKVTAISRDAFPFPEYSEKVPLHPIIKLIFTHHIGNDVYIINLIAGNATSTEPLSLEGIQSILNHAHSLKEFLDKLREATAQEIATSHSPEPTKDTTALPKRKLSREDIFLKLRNLIAQELKLPDAESIKPQTRFREDLDFDSLDTTMAVMAVEEEFGFEIADEDAEKILTLSQAVDYIFKRLAP